MSSSRKRRRGNDDSSDEDDEPETLQIGELFKRHRKARIRKAGGRREEYLHEAIINAQWDNLPPEAQQEETDRIQQCLDEGRKLSEVSDAPGAEPPEFTEGDITDSEGGEEPLENDKDSSSEEEESEGDSEDEESSSPYDGIIISGNQNRNDTQSTMDKYAKQNPPDYKDKKWEGPKQLGAGSGGNITLWLAKDKASHKIIDRIAIKDQFYTPDEWSSIRLWYGDPRNWGTREIMEAKALRDLNKAAGDGPGSQALVKLLACRLYMKRMASRVMMSYCGHGDVDGIIARYQQAGQKIPEAFIWAVFNALAQACVLMKYGDIQSKKNGAWQQIVHQDINPKNIFLDSAIANTSTDSDPAIVCTSNDPDLDPAIPNTITEPPRRPFPSYQQPVLGDFGHSIITSRYDDLNPYAYAAGNGTPSFRAPEQFPWIEDDTLLPAHEGKLLSPTNVYQVGITIAAMMHCKPVQGENVKTWRGPEDTVPGPDQNRGFEWEPNDVRQTYSKPLRKLMKKCVEWDSNDRIKATELKRKILKHTGGRLGTVDQAQGMRIGWPSTQAHADLVMPVHLLKMDHYAFNFSS